MLSHYLNPLLCAGALFFITAPDRPKCVHTTVNQKHALTATLPTTKRFCLEKNPLPEISASPLHHFIQTNIHEQTHLPEEERHRPDS